MIRGLDHVTINTGNLAATEKFYVDVVGFELAPRPGLGVPGIWLKAEGGDQSIVHVLALDQRTPSAGSIRDTVDHIAFHAQDFATARARVEAFGLPWCGNVIADFDLYQLMFYDPNGVLIELNFRTQDETGDAPVIPEGHTMTLENFFDPEAYTDF